MVYFKIAFLKILDLVRHVGQQIIQRRPQLALLGIRRNAESVNRSA